MPAHTAVASIGEVKMSNGMRLSHIEWRANRLADALAKQAAAVDQAPSAAVKLLDSGAHAAKHACKLLGRVTHAANHHMVHDIGTDGTAVSRMIRDSSDAPRRQPTSKVGQPAAKPAAKKAPAESTKVQAWKMSSGGGKSAAKSKICHRKIAEKAQADILQRRVAEIGDTLRPGSHQLSAAERIGTLGRRVLRNSTGMEPFGQGADSSSVEADSLVASTSRQWFPVP